MCCGMLTVILQFFTFFFCFHFSISSCPPEFKELCTCGYVKYGLDRKFVTNCTDSGFDNVLMLRKMPPMTEILVFVGNEVKDLPLNIFGQETLYKKLHTIDFSNNHIQTIKGRTFHNVGNVTKLILNDNDLYIVFKDHHPRMFSNFVNLRELHLKNAFTERVKAGDYLNNLVQIFGNSSLKQLRVLNMENNEISGIDPGEFCFLPTLEELYMGNNRLKDLSLSFSCLTHLKFIDVGHNLISKLSDETLQSLETRRSLRLNLTANPFNCDCNLVNTYEWMKTTPLNLIHHDYYYCYDGFPSSNIGQSVMAIAVEDLQCDPTSVPKEYHSSASFVVMIIGLICLSILLSVLTYKNWPVVSNHTRRIIRPLQCKFSYVSLERQENIMDV
ncbi:phospholipase A2 inhibitor [Parasteatoda tepidariorum]|uniref:phospholipase A2 inhibitor n=1 Tax=Parasteatoda tepidariorum TaxID=114398 RepID=UPI00077FDC6E|nr:phospholipase A2 inhibitor [Parasteatoda tepidariorum]